MRCDGVIRIIMILVSFIFILILKIDKFINEYKLDDIIFFFLLIVFRLFYFFSIRKEGMYLIKIIIIDLKVDY